MGEGRGVAPAVGTVAEGWTFATSEFDLRNGRAGRAVGGRTVRGRLVRAFEDAVRETWEGRLVRAADLDLASAEANAVLARMARAGRLVRVERGLYAEVVETRFGRRPPSVAATLAALVGATGERMARTRADLDNRLGLTTQVPMREIRLTTGRSRTLRLGRLSIELRHAGDAEVAAALAREAGATAAKALGAGVTPGGVPNGPRR